jgi:hypothetical protein
MVIHTEIAALSAYPLKGQDWGRSSSFKYQMKLERALDSTLQLIAAQGYLPALSET